MQAEKIVGLQITSSSQLSRSNTFDEVIKESRVEALKYPVVVPGSRVGEQRLVLCEHVTKSAGCKWGGWEMATTRIETLETVGLADVLV